MKYSYNWLKEFYPDIPAADKIADVLTMKVWEVEDYKKNGNDWILDIAILPNRISDASGHLGVARELVAIAAAEGAKSRLIMPKVSIKEDSLLLNKFLSVNVTDKKSCLRYSSRAIFGIKVGPSPKWLAERLISLGVAPINNVVDITNYVLLETGQPLHAFDYDKIAKNSSGKREILIRKARVKEKITTLDGQERILSSEDLVIADSETSLAIAGIKGGMSAGISPETINIVLEAANFEPTGIYKSSKNLNIETDAAKRFSAGLSQAQIPWALDRAAYLISTIAGGSVLGGVINKSSVRLATKALPFSMKRLNSMLGVNIPNTQAVIILKAIGCKVNLKAKNIFSVTPSFYRLDLNTEQDLIEEVGRLYGYGKIKSIPPKILVNISEKNEASLYRNKSKDFLVKAGFTELNTYSFMGESLAAAFGLPSEKLAELKNPVSEDKKFLRSMIIPRLLNSATENLKYAEELDIFEIADVFEWVGKKIIEKEHLGIARIIKNDENVLNNFRFIKGIINDLSASFGISDIVWRPCNTVIKDSYKYIFWSPANSAILEIGGVAIGAVGVLRHDISAGFSWPYNILVAEIDFSELVRQSTEEHEYRLPSKYPEAVRDIAVLVDGTTLVDEIGNEIARIGKSLIRDIELFDYYEGDNIPEGKKSLAFHVIYQSQTRTLKGKEIDDMHKKIISALSMRGWEIR